MSITNQVKNILLKVNEYHSKEFVIGPVLNPLNITNIPADAIFLLNVCSVRLGESVFLDVYTPPETINNNIYYGQYSDMWIVGLIIYKLIFERDLIEFNTPSLSLVDKYYNRIPFLKNFFNNFTNIRLLTDISSLSTPLNDYDKIFLFEILSSLINLNYKERPLTKDLLQKYYNIIPLPCLPPISKQNLTFNHISFLEDNGIYIKKMIENEVNYFDKIFFFNRFIQTFQPYMNFVLNDFVTNSEINSPLFVLKLNILIKILLMYTLIKFGYLSINENNDFIKKYLYASRFVIIGNKENIDLTLYSLFLGTVEILEKEKEMRIERFL